MHKHLLSNSFTDSGLMQKNCASGLLSNTLVYLKEIPIPPASTKRGKPKGYYSFARKKWALGLQNGKKT